MWEGVGVGTREEGRGHVPNWRGGGQLRKLQQHLCEQPGLGGPGSGVGGDILLPQAQGPHHDFTQCSNTAGGFQMPVSPMVTGSGKCGEENTSPAVTMHKPTVGYWHLSPLAGSTDSGPGYEVHSTPKTWG